MQTKRYLAIEMTLFLLHPPLIYLFPSALTVQIARAEQAISSAPTNPRHWGHLGMLYEAHGYVDRARAGLWLQRVIEGSGSRQPVGP